MKSIARACLALLAVVPCLVLLLPVFAVAYGLHAFAFVVRTIARLIEPRFVPWTALIAFDRAVGWKPKPGLNAYYLAEHDDVFKLVTDREGWPGSRTLDDSEIVVVGDSFAAGYGMDTSRSFAELDSRLRIKAVGAPGYSMVQGVILMEQLGRRLAGKLVVWFVYLENDLQDNLAPEMRRYRAPFVRRTADAWQIVDRHVEPARWRTSNQDVRRLFPYMCVPGPLADRAYDACDYLIGRARVACDRAGARLAIVSIPHPMQLTPDGVADMGRLSGRPEECDENLPDRRVAESCRRHAVPLVVAKDHLSRRDYKRREGIHWNARGHRRMAALVGRLHGAFGSGDLDALIPGALRPTEGARPSQEPETVRV